MPVTKKPRDSSTGRVIRGPWSKTDVQEPELIHYNLDIYKKIEILDLSPHTGDLLRDDNIEYVGDFVQKTEAEILHIAGREALDEIEEALAQIGLHLNMDMPDWPPDNIAELSKRVADY
jgi:DNA-directed RNA polymerase subunit alpha